MQQSRLARWFEEAGEAVACSIESGDSDWKQVVALTKRLHRDRPFLFDPIERYVAFVVERYLRTVYGNLCMDTPYSETLKIKRRALLGDIGTSLKKVSELLNAKNLAAVHVELSSMVNAFFNLVDELNVEFERPRSGKEQNHS